MGYIYNLSLLGITHAAVGPLLMTLQQGMGKTSQFDAYLMTDIVAAGFPIWRPVDIDADQAFGPPEICNLSHAHWPSSQYCWLDTDQWDDQRGSRGSGNGY